MNNTMKTTKEEKMKPILKTDWEKNFLKLIYNWRTFGAEEDPENFEPYITFDRKHDFDGAWGFMPKMRKLMKVFIAQVEAKAVERERQRVLGEVREIVEGIRTKEIYDMYWSDDSVAKSAYGSGFLQATDDLLQQFTKLEKEL